jgi:hypothetical protein
MVAFLVRLAGRIAWRAIERLLFQNEWFVAYRRRTEGAGPPTDLGGFIPIKAPDGHFYADPFVVMRDGGHHLFVEDFDRATGLGSISVLRLEDVGVGVASPEPVLDRPFHLSYPFLATDENGSLIMIPESGDHGTTTMYRPVAFPGSWQEAGVIFSDLRAYDPTFFRYQGRTWLFVSVAERGANPWDELFLFSAPGTGGPWTPHPANPIVSDVRMARPAGRIFSHDGVLLRPAQDCSGAYGRRVVLQEIVTLNESAYRERPWGAIEPSGLPGVRRTNCYNADGDYEVVDGFRMRARFGSMRLRR